MAIKTFDRPKDPDEVVDYGLDWSPHLKPGDVINGSIWLGFTGTLIEGAGGNSFTDTQTAVWIEGGTLDTTYELLNRVTTFGGRTYDRSVKLKVKKR